MGEALPAKRVDNEELAFQLGRSAEEIERRSGVRHRYYAAAGEGPSDLARRAADTALKEAGARPQDIEFLIFATMTPDVTFPGSGCYLQEKLGCATIGALDVRGQCAGFLLALEIASQFLLAGAYHRILVAAGDVHSSGLDFSPRGAEVTPLFGDGASVVVLGAEGNGLLQSVIHSDATHFERFWCEFPSSRRPPVRITAEDIREGRHYPRIDVAEVKRDGLEQIRAGVEEVLGKAGIGREKIARYFLHHIYPDVAEEVAERLGVRDRTTLNGREEGHIGSASLPISLCRSRQKGETRPGDLVCLATAGAGANWGATLIRL
jgi:3-oxoacyl-[acyl-carrier-protein] synthase-3